MKVLIQDGNYEFSCDFKEERPNVEDAAFALYYLLGKLYPRTNVKESLESILGDI